MFSAVFGALHTSFVEPALMTRDSTQVPLLACARLSQKARGRACAAPFLPICPVARRPGHAPRAPETGDRRRVGAGQPHGVHVAVLRACVHALSSILPGSFASASEADAHGADGCGGDGQAMRACSGRTRTRSWTARVMLPLLHLRCD